MAAVSFWSAASLLLAVLVVLLAAPIVLPVAYLLDRAGWFDRD